MTLAAARPPVPLADAQAAAGTVDADLHPVQPVAIRIVAGGEAAAGDRIPAVVGKGELLGNDEGGGIADDLAVIGDDELSFRKGVDLAADLAGGIGQLTGIDPPRQIDDRRDVGVLRGADLQVAPRGRRRQFHPGTAAARLGRLFHVSLSPLAHVRGASPARPFHDLGRGRGAAHRFANTAGREWLRRVVLGFALCRIGRGGEA